MEPKATVGLLVTGVSRQRIPGAFGLACEHYSVNLVLDAKISPQPNFRSHKVCFP